MAAERASFASIPTVDGRTISGLVIPWDTAATDRPIQFGPSSVRWNPRGPVLRLMHDGASEAPLARLGGTMTITAGPEGLTMSATLPETSRANDALALMAAGVIDSLSAEVAIERTDSTTTPPTVLAALLVAVALVPAGAFDDALLFARQRVATRRRRRRMLAAALS